MNLIETPIKDLFIVEPRVFADSRGYFFESYNESAFESKGLNLRFVQDNQSKSSYGVIRGLHYQLPPFAQTKLVRALEGTILDVAVDIRKGSPTFGKWFSIELSAENKRQLLVPRGFAHGFSVLSESATVFYKCDNLYHPECEGAIAFNDPTLSIDWKIDISKAIVSDKDLKHPSFLECKNTFLM